MLYPFNFSIGTNTPNRGITYGSPTLSGVVFHGTPEGRRPWANTRVFYKSIEAPSYDVYVRSDEHGRYDVGRLPVGSGSVGAGDCNDAALYMPGEIRGDTVADIDVTWLVTTCPGFPF